jgi:hypothetical protein
VPLVLPIQGVINPRREVNGHGYTPLLCDRLSFVKRQFVGATPLSPVSDALDLHIDVIDASACPVLVLG